MSGSGPARRATGPQQLLQQTSNKPHVDMPPSELSPSGNLHPCCFVLLLLGLRTGKYVLLYDGQGKILVDGDATLTWQTQGRIGLTLTPANGFAVRIVESNVTNPVRNISIVPAAKELTFTTDVYQPAFLKLVNGE